MNSQLQKALFPIITRLTNCYPFFHRFREAVKNYVARNHINPGRLAENIEQFNNITEWLFARIEDDNFVPLAAILTVFGIPNNMNVALEAAVTTSRLEGGFSSADLRLLHAGQQTSAPANAADAQVNEKIRSLIPWLLPETTTLDSLAKKDSGWIPFVCLLVEFAERALNYPELSCKPHQNLKKEIELQVEAVINSLVEFPNLVQAFGLDWESVAQDILTVEKIQIYSGHAWNEENARIIFDVVTSKISKTPALRSEILALITLDAQNCREMLENIPKILYPPRAMPVKWKLPPKKSLAQQLSENIENKDFIAALRKMGPILPALTRIDWEHLVTDYNLSPEEKIQSFVNWKTYRGNL